MSTESVFRMFEELIPACPGVRTYLADYDAESGQAGFGSGMNRCLQKFISNPGPTVVVGLATEEDLRSEKSQRNIGRFLDLPCVKYCDIPITREEIQIAAESVLGKVPSPSILEDMGREVTLAVLERVNRNVTHVLKGGICATMRDKVDGIRDVLSAQNQAKKELTLLQLEPELNLKDAASLRYYCTRLAETVALLWREIEMLDGIGPKSVLSILRKQHGRLCEATDALKGFTGGIEAWARGDLVTSELEPFVVQGEKVSRVLVETSKELEYLPTKVRAASKRWESRA